MKMANGLKKKNVTYFLALKKYVSQYFNFVFVWGGKNLSLGL